MVPKSEQLLHFNEFFVELDSYNQAIGQYNANRKWILLEKKYTFDPFAVSNWLLIRVHWAINRMQQFSGTNPYTK